MHDGAGEQPAMATSTAGKPSLHPQFSYALATLLSLAFLLLAAFTSGESTWRQIYSTALLAGGSLSAALLCAAPLAVLLAKTDLPGRRGAWLVLGGLAIIPLFVHLAGWEAVLGKLGWLSGWGDPSRPPWLDGLRGAIWIHAAAAVPWLTIFIAVGLQLTPADEEEAALLEHPPLVVLRFLLASRALGAVAVGLAWLLVQLAGEMTVTNVYLVPTFAEELYNSFALSASATDAVVELLPALALLALLLALAAWVAGRATAVDLSSLARPRLLWPLGRWKILAGLFAWSLLGLLAVVPLGSLLYEAGIELTPNALGGVAVSWSPLKLIRTVGWVAWRMRGDFGWSLLLAASTATIVVALAAPLAWVCRRGVWRQGLLVALGALLTALPGPVVVAAVRSLLNRAEAPLLIFLYDRTIVPPLLALVVRTLPLVALLLWHGLRSVNRQMIELPELEGAGPVRIFTQVVLPQRKSHLCAAWLLAAALALGDVNYSAPLMPPGGETIARRLFGLLHSGVDDQAASACLLLIGGYFSIALLLLWFAGRARRLVLER